MSRAFHRLAIAVVANDAGAFIRDSPLSASFWSTFKNQLFDLILLCNGSRCLQPFFYQLKRFRLNVESSTVLDIRSVCSWEMRFRLFDVDVHDARQRYFRPAMFNVGLMLPFRDRVRMFRWFLKRDPAGFAPFWKYNIGRREKRWFVMHVGCTDARYWSCTNRLRPFLSAAAAFLLFRSFRCFRASTPSLPSHRAVHRHEFFRA